MENISNWVCYYYFNVVTTDIWRTSYTTNLEAAIVAGATEYRFRLSRVAPAYSATVTKFINKVALAEFVGLSPGATYVVEVSLKIDGKPHCAALIVVVGNAGVEMLHPKLYGK